MILLYRMVYHKFKRHVAMKLFDLVVRRFVHRRIEQQDFNVISHAVELFTSFHYQGSAFSSTTKPSIRHYDKGFSSYPLLLSHLRHVNSSESLDRFDAILAFVQGVHI